MPPQGMPPGYAPPPGYALPPGYAPVFPPVYMPQPMIPVASPVTQSALAPSEQVAADCAVPATQESNSVSPPLAKVPEVVEPPAASSVGETSGNNERRGLKHYWQQIGGGSLSLSLALHIGLLLIAGLVVFTTTSAERNIDFLPGGGTQQGEQASSDLATQVQMKRRSRLTRTTPMQRVVVQNATAAISLPDVPPDLLSIPDVGSMMSAGRMGSGGFGSAGAGGGMGSGIGMGGAKGFVGMTLFGKLGDEGVPGVFYDLKQNPQREATAYAGEIGEGEYAGVINSAAAKKFTGKSLDEFFRSTQKMSFNYLLVPYMAAEEGPKAFKVDKEVRPRGWIVHYGAQIQPPAPGDYRFVGMFDDALIVYINGKPVLDGSWYPIVGHGDKRRDEDIRQDFGGPVVPGTGSRHCYAGKWVRMEGSTRIDIIVGERPGGRVGGLLMVQAKKARYAERSDGSPILPVFSTAKFSPFDLQRLEDYSGKDRAFELARETPVFTVSKSLFKD